MKLTQYCMKCGQRLELKFGRLWKRCRCPACKVRFKYRETKDGMLKYDYRASESELFKEVENGGTLNEAV